MSITAIDGIVAGGRWPTFVIPFAAVETPPSGDGPWSLPLADLLDTTTVKIDCYLDPGDIQVSRTATTRARQRACQKVQETIKTGETIDLTLAGVYDQQAAMAAVVNKMYAALPEGAEVYVGQAMGWDSEAPPTTATVIDLYRAKVVTRDKNQPTSPDEDLKFTSVLSGSAFWADVTLTGP